MLVIIDNTAAAEISTVTERDENQITIAG